MKACASSPATAKKPPAAAAPTKSVRCWFSRGRLARLGAGSMRGILLLIRRGLRRVGDRDNHSLDRNPSRKPRPGVSTMNSEGIWPEPLRELISKRIIVGTDPVVESWVRARFKWEYLG